MVLIPIHIFARGDIMRFLEGFLTGMVLSIAGCVAFKFMFPETEKEMCESVSKITKDMGKELKNMS